MNVKMSINKSKQSTLFHSWGNKKQDNSKPGTSTCNYNANKSNNKTDDVINLCDDDEDDELLAQVLDESLKYADHLFPVDKQNEGSKTDEGNISFGLESEPQFSVTVPGFDRMSGNLWIYPTNYPVRDYQYNIVSQSLFKNTMVTLPTGLGKTFIAAVVMYNYYRWYPGGKIIFMAPTKPLVAQQIEACYNIMGIPQSDTAEMTGNMVPNDRLKSWKGKRVFFLTPQVITNDLSRGSCPAEDVKCVVVDEAHKALGNHAYCQVLRELVKYTTNFRVLALSATPGSDIKAVQQVLTNLLISHMEIRTEDCIDIKPYTHKRTVDKVVVPLGEELTKIKTKYTEIMDVVVKRLTRQKVVYNRPTTSFSKFLLLKSREEYRQNPPEALNPNQFGAVEGDFAMAISLFHGFELLQLHGLRSLYNYLKGIVSNEKGYGRTKSELQRNTNFNDIMNILSDRFSTYDKSSLSQKPAFVSGHPKMEKLLDIAVEHFEKFKDCGGTRIMIFSQYRDSVLEITDMLNQHPPVIKAMSFIGQSSVGKAAKGFTQKEQLRVMKEFREGGYNTLVSTCVGEEGLDIGDVDLIICFDAHKSPIRLVQRMGRTGRKREGRIVMLVTEGKEEQIYNQSQYSKKSIHKAILNGGKSLQFYQHNPRMVPNGLTPKCHKMFITVKNVYNPTSKRHKDGGGSKQPSEKTESKSKKSFKNQETSDITLEEYRDLQEYFTMDSSEIKLPVLTTDVISLNTDKQTMLQNTSNDSNRLSLSEWLPWQNRLQETHTVEHSNRSKHLVEIIQFVELQETLGDQGDNYRMEMEMFLNNEDVIKSGVNTTSAMGIKQYCKPNVTFDCDKLHASNRHGDNLPIIESIEYKDNIDDELPEFESKTSECDAKRPKSKQIVKNISDSVKITNIAKKLLKSNSTEKLYEKENNTNSVKSGKKRKKHFSEKSILINMALPEVDDDFEDDGKSLMAPYQVETSPVKYDSDVSIDTLIDDVCMVSPEKSQSVDDDNGDIKLPSRGLCFVRTPPPLEEVAAIFNDLADATVLPRVDLVQLVEEWHAEQEQVAASNTQFDKIDRTQIKPRNTSGMKHKMSVCQEPVKLISDEKCDNEIFQTNVQLESITSPRKRFSEGEKSVLKDESSKFSDNVIEENGDNIDISVKLNDKKTICDDLNRDNSPVGCDGDLNVKIKLSDMEYGQKSNLKLTSNSLVSNENQVLQSKPEIHKTSIIANLINVSHNTSKLGVSFSDADIFNDSEFDKELTLPVKQKSRQALSETQFNFTQALSFLDKTNPSFSIHSDMIEIPFTNYDKVQKETYEDRHSPDAWENSHIFGENVKNKSLLGTQTFIVSPDNSDEEMKSDNEIRNVNCDSKGSNSNSSKLQRPNSIEESTQKPDEIANDSLADMFDDNFDLPQFDLGFDLEDEEMIPPSPPVNPISRPSKHDITTRNKQQLKISPVQQNKSSPPNSNRSRYTESCNMERSSLSVFEKNKLKNFQDGQSPISDKINKQGVWSDRYSLKCSTPVKDVCVNEKTTSSQKSLFCHKDIDLDSNFLFLTHSSSKKAKLDDPKMEAVSVSENSVSAYKPETKVKSTWNSIESTKQHQSESKNNVKIFLKEMISASQEHTSDDLFQDEPDLDHFISNQFEILDNIRKNNMAVDLTVTDDEDNFETNPHLNLSLKSRLLLKSAGTVQTSNTIETVTGEESDEDDSIVIKRRRRTKKIDSPDSIKFKTPTKPIGRQKPKKINPLNTSSEEENEVVKVLGISDNFDEDFASPVLVSKSKQRVDRHVDEMKIKKKKKNRCAFIEEEAELSGEDVSSDESYDSDYQQLSGNFINDETQYTSHSKLNDTAVHAMYLKSVRSPVHHGKYRLQYNYKHHDVFSQVSREDENSEYMEDSFCVDNDYVDSMLSSEIKEIMERKHKVKNKTKTKHVNNVKGKKRLCKLSQSSSDDDMQPAIPLTQHTSSFHNSQIAPRINKRVFLTSSDDEEILQKHIETLSPVKMNNNNMCLGGNKVIDYSDKNVNKHGDIINKCDTIKDIKKNDACGSRNIIDIAVNKDASNAIVGVDFPNFDLDIDFLEDDLPSDMSIQTSTQKPESLRNIKSSSAVWRTGLSEQERLKQERLEKQKKLQEVFKAKHLKNSETSDSFKIPTDILASTSPKTKVLAGGSNMSSVLNDDILNGILPEQSVKKNSKLTIVVDSREISGAQEIISNLRLKHDINVEVRQLKSCDYVLSTRLAVDRQVWSEFSNGSNNIKVIDRLQKMRDLYDRCCLIVETDKPKAGTNKPTTKLHRTKYVDQLISMLSQSDVRLLFTDSQGETVSILVELCQLENKKGLSITTSLNLSDPQQQMLKFYLSIPKVTYIQAVNFVFKFNNISQFLNSSAKVIEVKGKLSVARSIDIYNYINKKFDLQMVPTNR